MRSLGAGRRARHRERGSALLIVFVFAAMIAIALYMELPIAAFEAKRQKEQLLIDRGHEYAHGVKLFVRKFGTYPATIEQLENTNRMRFLRHRFKDPFTGKDDWRLLHAGPGGMIVDSKVKPLGGLSGSSNGTGSSGFGSTQNASSGFGSTQNANSGFGSRQNASSGFGSTQNASSGFGSTSADSGMGTFGTSSSSSSSGDTVVVPATPQRPPAISSSGGPSLATGTGENGAATSAAQNDQSPTAPLLPPGVTDQAAGAAQNGTAAEAGNAAVSPVTAGASDSQNANDTMRKMLNNPGNGNPAIGAPLGGPGTTGRPLGQLSGGGIAGVASKAKGQSIKTVNDQTDYALWEFYYDPSKDATRGMPGIGPAGVQGGPNMPGAVPNPANSGFGTQSAFGSNNSGQGGFGQNGTVPNGPSQGGFNQSAAPSNTGATQPPQQ